MADTLHNDFIERDRRIELVGDLFLDTGYSTRKLSQIISSDNDFGFKISNATVFDYIQRYKTKHEDKADQIESLIEANKGSSIKNPLNIQRVYKVYELYMQNKSLEEIAKICNVSYWTIYYDINIRLKKIDKSLYNDIKNM